MLKITCFYVTLGTLKIRQDIMAQCHKTLRLIVHHIFFYSSYNHTHSCLETKLCFSVKHQTIFSQMSWHFIENIEKWCWPNPMDWPFSFNLQLICFLTNCALTSETLPIPSIRFLPSKICHFHPLFLPLFILPRINCFLST